MGNENITLETERRLACTVFMWTVSIPRMWADDTQTSGWAYVKAEYERLIGNCQEEEEEG